MVHTSTLLTELGFLPSLVFFFFHCMQLKASLLMVLYYNIALKQTV